MSTRTTASVHNNGPWNLPEAMMPHAEGPASVTSLRLCLSGLFPQNMRFAIAVVQSFIHVQLFATPWTVACQASLSIINSRSLLKLMSIKSGMPSNHLILCCVPLSSYPQSFPASGSFPMSQFFASGGQSIGVSASTSVLPMNTQD